MYAATRYVKAIPLCTLRAHAFVKPLIRFYSTFGLPKYTQSDQGSNIISKLFANVIGQLNITHQVSSAYHPESQGALERFNLTMKTMLRSYSLAEGKGWDERFPLLFFAACTTVQVSHGFSPEEWVLGQYCSWPPQSAPGRVVIL